MGKLILFSDYQQRKLKFCPHFGMYGQSCLRDVKEGEKITRHNAPPCDGEYLNHLKCNRFITDNIKKVS